MTAKVEIDGKTSGAVTAIEEVVDATERAEKATRDSAREYDRAADASEKAERAAKQQARATDDAADAAEDGADALEKFRREAERAAESSDDLSGGIGGVSGALGRGGAGGGGLLAGLGAAGLALGGASLAFGALRGAVDAVWESTERYFQSVGREDLWESAERSARRYTGTLFTLVTGTDDADEAHRRLIAGLDAGYVVVDRMAGVVRPLTSLLGSAFVTAIEAAGVAAQIATGNFDSLETELQQVETQAQRTAAAARTVSDELDRAMSSTLIGQAQTLRAEMEGLEQAAILQYATERARQLGIATQDVGEYVQIVSQMVNAGEDATVGFITQIGGRTQTLRIAGDELATINEILDQQQRNGVSLLDAQIERAERLAEIEGQIADRRRRADEPPPAPVPTPTSSSGGTDRPADFGPLLAAGAQRLQAFGDWASAALAEIEGKEQRTRDAAQESKLRQLDAERLAEEERIRIAQQAAEERARIAEEEARRQEQIARQRVQLAQYMATSLAQIDLRSADRAEQTARQAAGQVLQVKGMELIAEGIGQVAALNPIGGLKIAGGGIMIAAGRRIAAGGDVGSSGGAAMPAAQAAPARPVTAAPDVRYDIVNSFGIVGDQRQAAALVADSVRRAQREGML